MLTLFDEVIVTAAGTYRFAGDADEPGRVYYEWLSASGEWRRHETSAATWRSFVRGYGNHANAVV